MNIWRCAGARPDGTACLRRVRTRPSWWVDQQRWIGQLCDRCWREQLDAHPARVLEIAGDSNAPDDIIRVLSRLDDSQLELVIASRGDRMPDDVRTHLKNSERADVRQAASNTERVPLEPALWLYRRKPTPSTQRWAAVATVLVVVLAVGALAAITMRDPTTPAVSETPQVATSTPDVVGDSSLQTHEFAVEGAEGSICILFVTVTEVSEYTLISPDGTTDLAAGFTSVTGPPGTWAIDYFAPPSTSINPSIEIDSCS